MVIVIDDLDRISASEINKILYTINSSFNLPGISYILCYDMDNICKKGSKEEIQKNVEFLDKFVQVKLSLFSDKEKILRIVNNKQLYI